MWGGQPRRDSFNNVVKKGASLADLKNLDASMPYESFI
jgi:hypothetical protein